MYSENEDVILLPVLVHSIKTPTMTYHFMVLKKIRMNDFLQY
jgi:hypothetical protein